MCSLWSGLYYPTSVWPITKLSYGKSSDRFELIGNTGGLPKVVGCKWCRIGMCGIATFFIIEKDFVECFFSTYGKINSLNTICLKIGSFHLSSRHLQPLWFGP